MLGCGKKRQRFFTIRGAVCDGDGTVSPSLDLVILLRWDLTVGMSRGALVNSTIFILPRPRPLFRVGAEASSPDGVMEARASSYWQLVEREVLKEDLHRRLGLLPS